MPVDKK